MLKKEFCDNRFGFFWEFTPTKYDYDENGIRIQKTTPTKTTFFIEKYTELRGSDIVRNIFAGDRQVASIDELNEITYDHKDHLGSSNLRTDASGNIIKRIEYLPYGDKRIQTGVYNSIKNRFTGQIEDEESGLYYYKQRYYDPVLSRFVSADPLYLDEINSRGILSQKLNLFSYGQNNPIKFVDPLGLEIEYTNYEATLETADMTRDNAEAINREAEFKGEPHIVSPQDIADMEKNIKQDTEASLNDTIDKRNNGTPLGPGIRPDYEPYDPAIDEAMDRSADPTDPGTNAALDPAADSSNASEPLSQEETAR